MTNDNNAVALRTDNTTQRIEMLELIATGKITTVEELSNRYNLSPTTAIAILADPRTITAIKQVTEAKANLFFHTTGVSRMMRIAQDEDAKTALQGLKLLAQISNNLKQDGGANVNVNINLEQLLKADEKKVNAGVEIDI